MRCFLIALCVSWLFSGCIQPPAAQVNSQSVQYDPGLRSTTNVVEFRLADGTRCVVIAARGSSITCEWRQPVVLVPRVE